MRKERIYISGGITNVPDAIGRFLEAQKELESKGYMVYNPAHANIFMPEGTTYEEYMKVSFLLLDMADSIYMLKGWEKSCGANREYGYAIGKGKKIIFEQEEADD